MRYDVLVLGAGIAGVSVAIHLALRGRAVLLVDRQEPGRETSYGNGGIIQGEGVYPFRFPRDWRALARFAGNRSLAVRYRPGAILRDAAALARYWRNSAPDRYARIVADYSQLILNATAEHAALIDAAEADMLVSRNGWTKFYRDPAAWDDASAIADRITAEHGIAHRKLDSAGLRALEPHLRVDIAGAIQWPDALTITDPGALVAAYAALFRRLGGAIARGDARTSRQQPDATWQVETQRGAATANAAVIALGPWSGTITRRLGYRLPMIAKRGYHFHYASAPGTRLHNLLVDADQGVLLAPMRQGIRLTTGAEFAGIDAPPDLAQIGSAETLVRSFFPLGERIEARPWLGTRPCTVDMKPVIGPAPRHPGLWFLFGHGHHGLTLGPITGRLLAEAIIGENPSLDIAPYRADRF